MTAKVIIIGTGPAALMAASTLSEAGINPVLFERRRGPGWKFLVAGSSGLNVTYDAPLADFLNFYRDGKKEIAPFIEKFPPEKWLEFIHSLGLETYLGTSRRYFLKTMKASPLLRAWIKKLTEEGAEFHYGEDFVDFQNLPSGEIEVAFLSGRKEKTRTLLLALGGGSWLDEDPRWPNILRKHGIAFQSFTPSNSGFHLEAPAEFFKDAEGKPIKGLILKTRLGEKQGELMITRYGLEGAPVYAVGCEGSATLDLKPDLSAEKLKERLKVKDIARSAKLSPGAALLVKYLGVASELHDKERAARYLKNFPIKLLGPRPLSESISSKGGLPWNELTSTLELKKAPVVFCAGEMIAWDAPTGGFLVQACVSTGYGAAEAIRQKLHE